MSHRGQSTICILFRMLISMLWYLNYHEDKMPKNDLKVTQVHTCSFWSSFPKACSIFLWVSSVLVCKRMSIPVFLYIDVENVRLNIRQWNRTCPWKGKNKKQKSISLSKKKIYKNEYMANTDRWINHRLDQAPRRSKHPLLTGHNRRDPLI